MTSAWRSSSTSRPSSSRHVPRPQVATPPRGRELLPRAELVARRWLARSPLQTTSRNLWMDDRHLPVAAAGELLGIAGHPGRLCICTHRRSMRLKQLISRGAWVASLVLTACGAPDLSIDEDTSEEALTAGNPGSLNIGFNDVIRADVDVDGEAYAAVSDEISESDCSVSLPSSHRCASVVRDPHGALARDVEQRRPREDPFSASRDRARGVYSR